MPTRLSLRAKGAHRGALNARFLATTALAALTATASPALISPALAQDLGIVLDDIVVEGTTLGDVAVDIRSQGSAVTVVTGEELEARQIRHAGEALRTVAGVDVSTTGGVGNITNIRIRGGEANHVSVRVDGVEVSSLDFGAFDFSTLTAADIERIEVIRGPQSGIYGANALSGVVNIITRKGADRPTITLQAEGGTFDARNFALSLGAGDDDAYINITGVAQRTEGYNLAQVGNEADGSEQSGLSVRTGGRINPYVRLDLSGRYQRNRGENDTDADFDGRVDDVDGIFSERTQLLGKAAVTVDLFDGAWQQVFAGNFLQDDLFDQGTFGVFTANGERLHAAYETTVRLGDVDPSGLQHFVTGLVEHREETFDAASAFSTLTERSRSQTGYALEYRGAYHDTAFLTANVRHDDNDSFADFTTYRVAGALKARNFGTRLHASVGTGIQNPTFFDQFGFAGNFQGNPDLEPEQSFGWDVGVEQAFLAGRAVIDVTYFNNDLTNQIGSTAVAPGISTPINLDGTSRREGVEVTVALKPVDGLTVAANYTYLETERPDGLVEVRRPEHSGSLTASYTFLDERANLTLSAVYNGDMEDDDFGTFPATRVTLDEYVVVNVAGRYAVTEEVELFGRVENLFDEDYEQVFTYRAPPLTAFAGVRIKLQDDAPLGGEVFK